MTIPFFLSGPNKHRHYSIAFDRWEMFLEQQGDYLSGLKTRHGIRTATVTTSLAIFLTGSLVCFALGQALNFPGFQGMGVLASFVAGLGCFYIPFADSRVSRRYPEVVIGK